MSTALLHVGFTGTSRGLTLLQAAALRGHMAQQTQGHRLITGHHGMCIGGDADFNAVARDLGWRTHGHPPVNQSKMAQMLVDEIGEPGEYLARNHDIVDATQYLIACPYTVREQWRGSGTWATIRYAGKQQKIIVYIWPDGKVTRRRRK